ncbi:MAG TPA: D-aminoacyl-tRNA deacylase [Thermomicrobiales bacterium]|nr:D-aminoacyl-tRNA deacylase [Thermomicrobiales bacterium]
MRFLLQRVREAQVTVDEAVVGAIGHGLLVLVGIGPADTLEIGQRLVVKTLDLRIFEDDDGKMNRSLRDVIANDQDQAGLLMVSQFTLYADVRKGRRPSFTDAAPPELASKLFDQLVAYVRDQGIPCATGTFGAHMAVSLVNDGPVTFWLDSETMGIA